MSMSKLSQHNKSLLFLLIFTIVSSVMAYQLVMRAYDGVFAYSELELVGQ
ncbi:MAG: hypothetical protein UW07_C0039G0028 [Candidatus Nomurabacteria bacterium GW2011_GWF2_43_8]|uniref:Uncharacterized protein n=3 Tax=Candidatus Nomuraibacteriota TaxID=1752729 RepID=A0A0G1FIV3_9BACT|nr:MAG: hypothetical protein UV76_C0001G0004 [Candidatus Nomurabacteria bacterium GW2011_GWA2_43_15]KKT19286.1 MAG: hypothetical protein UW02_C0012G0017 [Candidatus Nomurabacteria bacterium GW2011_GWB1_43_7]KKT22320.1 MAG: hypothetical protein UW07_C0039G0028 [Candidatus Nomurabacteria bacterium GW2011_GWF2_43_8]